MNESSDLRIRLSFGALFAIAFIATLHAITVSVGMRVHKSEDSFHFTELPPLLSAPAPEPTYYSSSPEALPQVNLTAQSERKGSSMAENSPSAGSMKDYVPPGKVPQQQIGQIGPMNQPSTFADCPNCPQPYPPQPYYPAPRPPQPNPSPTRPTAVKEYQLLLFVSNDAQSQQLLSWFNNHPRFSAWRRPESRIAIQVYSPGDTLYRTRYASVVPLTEFPAIVVADRDGGHIHAASKQFIPRDPDKLYSDILEGSKLYLQAKQQRPADARTSGAMTATRQYGWDERISPDMRWQQSLPPEEGFRPLDNVRPGGGLFDSVCGPDGCKPKSALLWTDASEILTVGLVIVGIIAAIGLINRMRQ